MSERISPSDPSTSISRPHSRLLVPLARRPFPATRILLIPIIGAVYLAIGLLHPIYGSSPYSVLLLAGLAMLSSGYALMSPNADLLDPMRVVSFYFFIVFCIAPLGEQEVAWHYTRQYVYLLPPAVAFTATAYLMILLGYHLPLFHANPNSISARHEAYDHRLAKILAVMIFATGLASWGVLVILAGGLEGLLYSGLARGEFFEGFGFFFWAAMFMFPGATLYWSAQCVGKERTPWIHALPLVLAFLCFLVLQGRMRAMNFLILGLFIAHYMIRPIKPWRLAVVSLGGAFLAIFVGIVRAPSTRAEAFLNPLAVLRMIGENFEQVGRGFLAIDLSRLQQIVLILDKVPAWMPHDWGRSFLMIANPWIRLFGITGFSETEGIGPRIFRLAHPDIGFLPTGYLPSFVGEMLVNFPWYIAWVFFIPYGIALRLLYRWLIVDRGDFVAVTIYAILLLQAANVVLQSLGHVAFEMVIVVVPIFVVQLLVRRRGPGTPRRISEPAKMQGL